jgi:protein SCO1/2
MQPSPARKLILLGFVASLLAVVAAAFAVLMKDSFDRQVQFELFDQSGAQVSAQDFAGKYLLAFFGFTHCPQICPTQMSRVSAIVDALGGRISQTSIVPVFISVDPERDTIARVRDYVSRFHPAFIGLTGPQFQVARTLKSFRSILPPAPKTAASNYDVPHTAVIYLIGPDGRLLTHLPGDSGTTESLARIREAVL